jgi:hypothetical protein
MDDLPSAGSPDVPDRLLRGLRSLLVSLSHRVPLRGYEAPETLSYAISSSCPIGPDGEHSRGLSSTCEQRLTGCHPARLGNSSTIILVDGAFEPYRPSSSLLHGQNVFDHLTTLGHLEQFPEASDARVFDGLRDRAARCRVGSNSTALVTTPGPMTASPTWIKQTVCRGAQLRYA